MGHGRAAVDQALPVPRLALEGADGGQSVAELAEYAGTRPVPGPGQVSGPGPITASGPARASGPAGGPGPVSS